MNISEELVSSYLQYILVCEFIQKKLYTVDAQGEIDVELNVLLIVCSIIVISQKQWSFEVF